MFRISRLFTVCLVSTGFLSISVEQVRAQAEYVKMTDKGNYYLVHMNLQSASYSVIGSKLGGKILAAVPDYKSLLDSYLAEGAESDFIYNILLSRMEDIRAQVPVDYQNEVDALSTGMNLVTTNVRGDGQLSRDELWLYNLIPDIARETQCTAIGVFNSRSATGNTMVTRLLDWDVGGSNQLAKIQAVYRISNGSKTITTIGFLGYQAILSGYNDDNVFVSILDSETGQPYTSTGKRSYVFDLRHALENEDNFSGLSDYMKDPSRNYAFNHLIFMADANNAAVLENNFSGTGSNMRRALRYSNSVLNSGIDWGFTDAVASVNTFMLDGNHDNSTGKTWNTARWGSIRSQLTAKGAAVSWSELKEIARL